MGVTCGGNLWDYWHRASDRCSRLFPCISDPARRSALSLQAALVTLHLVFAGVLFLFDNDLIEKTKQEPWHTAIYLLLFVATLTQYFITSGTSPGFVLDTQKDVDELDASARTTLFASNKDIQSSKNGSVVITVDGRNYHRGNATAWTKLVMDLYPPGTSLRNLTCPHCNVLQPPRAKHCHDCDKCVLQFDHHCVWLGTCIGQGNHCRFWWYICEETALCLWTSILYLGYLKLNISKAWWVDVIMILLLAALSITLIFLLLLLLFHSYLVVTNQTTYELVRRRRIGYMRIFFILIEAYASMCLKTYTSARPTKTLQNCSHLLGIPERVYPFSKGACRNLYFFCCASSSMYRMEPLPSPQQIVEMSRLYTCSDVLLCRCCAPL